MEDKKTELIQVAGTEEAVQLNSAPESVALNFSPEQDEDKHTDTDTFQLDSELELSCETGNLFVKIIGVISKAGQTREGSVYKVEDKDKNILALKVYRQLRSEDEPNPVALQRVKEISSPGILPLVEYGVGRNKIHGKYCWELQEYAEGGNLLSIKDIKAKYTPEFIEHMLVPQLLQGLWKLHDNGIYHCDLKPQNVFFLDAAQTNIVIGDYGSAKTKEINVSDSFVFSKSIVGTHTYIPPEFHEGFIKDNSDYFSMGMIILELLYYEAFANDSVRVKEDISLRRNRHEPIFNFLPQYKRLNKLIEGCTLASWDRRWNRSDIIAWQKGHIAPIIYRDTRIVQELKLTRQVSVKTVDELVEYGWSLGPDEFYSVLIEDEVVFSHIQSWIFDILSADDARVFTQIRNVYGLKGKYQLKEALLRFIEPNLPLVCNGKLFKFIENQLPAVVLNYLDELLHSGMLDNPRILEQAVFSLEYALLMLKNSDINSIKKEAENIHSILRFILAEREVVDPILGIIANCDEQNNAEFFKSKINLIYLCIQDYTSEENGCKDLMVLVRNTIKHYGIKHELMNQGKQRKFSSEELKWWLRLINPKLHPILTTCKKSVSNESEIASRIINAFFDIDAKADPLPSIAQDVRDLDERYQKMDTHELVFELNILLTKIHGWAKIHNEDDLSLINKLLNCVPFDYQKPEKYLSWGNSIPEPAKVLIKMAWTCAPERGIRGVNGKLYSDLTAFLQDFVCDKSNEDAIWWEICEFCNIKRGSEKVYNELFDLLIDQQTQIDTNLIKLESGSDFEISELTMHWQDGLVTCKTTIYSSLVLRCEQEGKEFFRQYISKSFSSVKEVKIEKAIYFGKRGRSRFAVNMNNEKGYQALEVKIMQAALGNTVPSLLESDLHDSRLKEIKQSAALAGNQYKRQLRHKRIENMEAYKALFAEGFRWLSMGLIIPFIWIAYKTGSDIASNLIPLFLYGIPLIVIIGALPFFHQNRIKWSILIMMLIIIGYAVYKGYDDLHKLLIMLSCLKYLILYIVAVQIQSFFNGLQEYYIKARVVAIAIFLILGLGSISSITLNAWKIEPLLANGTSGGEINNKFVKIPGGQVSFQGHKTRLDPYYIAKHETTVREYRNFIMHSNYKTEAEYGKASLVFSDRGVIYDLLGGRETSYKTNTSWLYPNIKQSDNHPVVCVSFKDAVYFCNWLSQKEGYKPCYSIFKDRIYCNWRADGYRLPTEMEWEWAASGASIEANETDSSKLFFPIAWYMNNIQRSTKPVMMKNPNDIGIYDMFGNVSEWCWDLYQKNIPTQIPDNYRGPRYGKYRCVRGGSWCRDGYIINAKKRNKNVWGKDGKSLTSASFIGFRIVRKANE